MIQFGRFEITSNIEILQCLDPLLLILQQMNRSCIWPKLMCALCGRLRKIVHRPLSIIPILCTVAFSDPITKNFILWPFQMIFWHLWISNPLYNIPWDHVSHARHIMHKRVHARAWDNITIVQIFSGQWF